jgi:hypothetical protein
VIGARHMEHAGTTEGGETVGRSLCGSQLSPGGRSTEMIGDRRPDTNRRFSSRASARTCCQRPKRGDSGGRGPPVAAPGTGNRHVDLRCFLWPGQALVTEFQDLLCGGQGEMPDCRDAL